MKYHISREQRFFFDQRHYIEFDGLLSNEEQKRLKNALLKESSVKRDISSVHSDVREIVLSRSRAKLASELSYNKVLRFGFDELFVQPNTTKNLLNEICIQGLIICLFLDIDSDDGRGIFTLPNVDISELPLDPNKRYLLIGWAEEKAIYIMQPNDPHTHELKKRGYVFGDRLQEKWHPIINR